MKKKEYDQLKEKTPKELEELLGKLKLEAEKMRLETGREKSKNVHLYYGKRKDIAKIMTLISEKTLLGKPLATGEDSKGV